MTARGRVVGVRLFAAVVPPVEVLEHLDEFWSVRREAAAFRWTVPEQWHLTLAFLPSVADRHLDDLLARLERAGGRRTPFRLRIAGGGAFGSVAHARVLWAGVDAGTAELTELDRLAVGCRAAASRAGTEVEGGRFRPHLTLARIGQPQDVTNWVRLLGAYRGPEFEVTGFELIASHLGEGPRRRPRYEVLERFVLGR